MLRVVLEQRLKDSGVSVRKRAIKILRDLVLAHPDLHLKTNICASFAERIGDVNEEGRSCIALFVTN